MTQPARPVFAIFEGGGAKGVAHVGALAAAEANGLFFYGVAGASAGAVIATLISVGFAAEEIMHPTLRDKNLLAANGHTPITILGQKEWKAFARLAKGLHRSSKAMTAFGAAGSFLIAPRTTLSARRVISRHGHFDTKTIKAFVDAVLRKHLAEPFGAMSFQVTYGYNMAKDADDRLLLDHRGRGVPRAYNEKTLVFAPIGAAWHKRDQDYMTKYERALVRAGIRSLICIPVFEDDMAWALPPARRPTPAGVLSFDSDADLSADFNDSHMRSLLARRSTLLFPALKAGVPDGQA